MAGSAQPMVIKQFSGEGDNPHTLSLMWASNVEFDIQRSVTAYMRPTAVQQLAVVGRSIAEGSAPGTKWNLIFPDLHAQATREDAAGSSERRSTRSGAGAGASGEAAPEAPFRMAESARAGINAICAMFLDSKGDTAKPARKYAEWTLSHDKTDESIQRLKLYALELGIPSNSSQLAMKLFHAIPEATRSEVVRLLPAGTTLQMATIDTLAVALASYTSTTAYAEAFRPQVEPPAAPQTHFRGHRRAFSAQARPSTPEMAHSGLDGNKAHRLVAPPGAPRLCYSCGKPGHLAASCPSRAGGSKGPPAGGHGTGFGGRGRGGGTINSHGGRGGRGQHPAVAPTATDSERKVPPKSALKAGAAVTVDGSVLDALRNELSDLRLEMAQMGGSSAFYGAAATVTPARAPRVTRSSSKTVSFAPSVVVPPMLPPSPLLQQPAKPPASKATTRVSSPERTVSSNQPDSGANSKGTEPPALRRGRPRADRETEQSASRRLPLSFNAVDSVEKALEGQARDVAEPEQPMSPQPQHPVVPFAMERRPDTGPTTGLDYNTGTLGSLAITGTITLTSPDLAAIVRRIGVLAGNSPLTAAPVRSLGRRGAEPTARATALPLGVEVRVKLPGGGLSSAARLVLIDSGADKTFVSRLCALGKSLEAYVRAGAYKVTPGRTLFVGALGSKPMAADGRVEDVTFALSNGAQTATWESPVYLTDSRAYDVLVGMDSNRCLGMKLDLGANTFSLDSDSGSSFGGVLRGVGKATERSRRLAGAHAVAATAGVAEETAPLPPLPFTLTDLATAQLEWGSDPDDDDEAKALRVLVVERAARYRAELEAAERERERQAAAAAEAAAAQERERIAAQVAAAKARNDAKKAALRLAMARMPPPAATATAPSPTPPSPLTLPTSTVSAPFPPPPSRAHATRTQREPPPPRPRSPERSRNVEAAPATALSAPPRRVEYDKMPEEGSYGPDPDAECGSHSGEEVHTAGVAVRPQQQRQQRATTKGTKQQQTSMSWFEETLLAEQGGEHLLAPPPQQQQRAAPPPPRIDASGNREFLAGYRLETLNANDWWRSLGFPSLHATLNAAAAAPAPLQGLFNQLRNTGPWVSDVAAVIAIVQLVLSSVLVPWFQAKRDWACHSLFDDHSENGPNFSQAPGKVLFQALYDHCRMYGQPLTDPLQCHGLQVTPSDSSERAWCAAARQLVLLVLDALVSQRSDSTLWRRASQLVDSLLFDDGGKGMAFAVVDAYLRSMSHERDDNVFHRANMLGPLAFHVHRHITMGHSDTALLTLLPFVVLAFEGIIDIHCVLIDTLGTPYYAAAARDLYGSHFSAQSDRTLCLAVMYVSNAIGAYGGRSQKNQTAPNAQLVLYRRFSPSPPPRHNRGTPVRTSSPPPSNGNQPPGAASAAPAHPQPPQPPKRARQAEDSTGGPLDGKSHGHAGTMDRRHTSRKSGPTLGRMLMATIGVQDEYGTVERDAGLASSAPTAPAVALAAPPPPTGRAHTTTNSTHGPAASSLREVLASPLFADATERRGLIGSAVMHSMLAALGVNTGLVYRRVADRIATTRTEMEIYELLDRPDELSLAVAACMPYCSLEIDQAGEQLQPDTQPTRVHSGAGGGEKAGKAKTGEVELQKVHDADAVASWSTVLRGGVAGKQAKKGKGGTKPLKDKQTVAIW